MRLLRAHLLFFNHFNRASLSISAISWLLLWQAGNPYFIIVMFWLKVGTWLVLLGYQFVFDNTDLSFFRNLGLTPTRLYGFSVGLDLLIWFLPSVLILQL